MPASLIGLLVALLQGIQGDTIHLPDTTLPYVAERDIIVPDTGRYASLRVDVINPGDSLVFIESIEPSCGCILATVQRSLAVRGRPGTIYVALNMERMDTLQPVTIDIITNRTRTPPLRVTIRKKSPFGAHDPDQ